MVRGSNTQTQSQKGEAKKGATGAGSRTKYDITVFAVDVGASSGLKSVEGSEISDLERSREVVDWVLSRKIMTNSQDKFSLMFFGHETTTDDESPNVYFQEEEPQAAKIDWLRVITNEREMYTNPKCPGNFVTALIAALNHVKAYLQDADLKRVSDFRIVLISNLAGLPKIEDCAQMLQYLADGFSKTGASLTIVGPDFSQPSANKNQEVGLDFFRQLETMIGLEALSFEEGLSKLKFFVPKVAATRGQPFDFEIGKDLSIKLQMYVKNGECKMDLRFDPVKVEMDKNGKETYKALERKRGYKQISGPLPKVPDRDIPLIDDDLRQEINEPQEGKVDKDMIVRSYKYGATDVIVPSSWDEMIKYPKEEQRKQLQLLQFTLRKNILPQYIISGARYLLPASKDPDALAQMSALVNAMIELDVVALSRYAYNAIAKPTLACLIPKISKRFNYPILVHYQMPFAEAFRYYDFPPLEAMGPAPTIPQLDAIDAYIDQLLLAPVEEDDEKKGPPKELLRKTEVMNPKHQFQCQTLRQKAMHPEEPFQALSEPELARLFHSVSPQNKITDLLLTDMKGKFKLELNEKTKLAAFAKEKKRKEALGERGPSLDDFVLTSILALMRVDDNMELVADVKQEAEEIEQKLPKMELA